MLSQHSKLKRRAKTAASMAVPEITKPLLMWGKSQELVLTVGEAGRLDNWENVQLLVGWSGPAFRKPTLKQESG